MFFILSWTDIFRCLGKCRIWLFTLGHQYVVSEMYRQSSWFFTGKKVACFLQVRGMQLPQTKEFNYLEVVVCRRWQNGADGLMNQNVTCKMRALFQPLVVRKELNWEAKFLIYWSVNIPLLTFCQGSYVFSGLGTLPPSPWRSWRGEGCLVFFSEYVASVSWSQIKKINKQKYMYFICSTYLIITLKLTIKHQFLCDY